MVRTKKSSLRAQVRSSSPRRYRSWIGHGCETVSAEGEKPEEKDDKPEEPTTNEPAPNPDGGGTNTPSGGNSSGGNGSGGTTTPPSGGNTGGSTGGSGGTGGGTGGPGVTLQLILREAERLLVVYAELMIRFLDQRKAVIAHGQKNVNEGKYE